MHEYATWADVWELDKSVNPALERRGEKLPAIRLTLDAVMQLYEQYPLQGTDEAAIDTDAPEWVHQFLRLKMPNPADGDFDCTPFKSVNMLAFATAAFTILSDGLGGRFTPKLTTEAGQFEQIVYGFSATHWMVALECTRQFIAYSHRNAIEDNYRTERSRDVAKLGPCEMIDEGTALRLMDKAEQGSEVSSAGSDSDGEVDEEEEYRTTQLKDRRTAAAKSRLDLLSDIKVLQNTTRDPVELGRLIDELTNLEGELVGIHHDLGSKPPPPMSEDDYAYVIEMLEKIRGDVESGTPVPIDTAVLGEAPTHQQLEIARAHV